MCIYMLIIDIYNWWLSTENNCLTSFNLLYIFTLEDILNKGFCAWVSLSLDI